MAESKEERVDSLMRDAIAETFDELHMVGIFIVIAEVTDEQGETSLFTWWDGGSGWTRLGMAEWYAEKMRMTIEGSMEEDDDE